MYKKFPSISFIASENAKKSDNMNVGVVATQTQCSSSQNSGCRSHNTNGDIDAFLKVARNSPARKKS